MSITNKGELRTAILNEVEWNSSLNDRADEWITRTTQNLARDLRVNQMLATTTGTLTASTATLAVPSDFLGVDTFYLTTGGASEPVVFVTASVLETTVPNNANGLPTNAAIIGSNIRLKPIPDAGYDYTLVYFARPSALTADSDTNWILDNHSDAYLYGALTFAGLYLSDIRVQTWGTLYTRALQGIEQDSERAQFPIGEVQVTLDASIV